MASKPKADLLNEQDELTRKFIKNLSELLRILKAKNKNDADIEEIHERFGAIKTRLPAEIMKGGKYMWKYRNEITQRNEKAILANDFSVEYADAQNTLQETGQFEKFPTILNKIKFTWGCLNPAEKDAIWRLGTEMIGYLAQHAQNQKVLEQ